MCRRPAYRTRMHRPTVGRQQGAVALMVLALMLVLVAAAGLGVEAGRLYVNRAELQTAADACAIAAAQRLNCTSTDSTCLTAAENAGVAAAALNKTDLQSTAASVSAGNVTFSTTLNGTYSTRASGLAANNALFARCNAGATGLTPWILGVAGIGSSSVWAGATATLAPTASAATYVPMGICSTALTGKSVGDWIDLDPASNMRFIAGNTAAVNDVLAGEVLVTGVSVGSTLKAQTNDLNSVGSAFNTRFGIYQGSYAASTSPPDFTGYAYPNKSPGSPVITTRSAFSDYNTRAKSSTSSDRQFLNNQYSGAGANKNPLKNDSTAAYHLTYGKSRRLVQTAVLNCSGSGSSLAVTGMVCLLLLNPMANGSDAAMKVEYLGSSSTAGSPCSPAIGGPTTGGTGPLVPTLVQ